MRLEPLCRISMRYERSNWHRPYGPLDGDGEALGFGVGQGRVEGEIAGDLEWANAPRRRQDGVWMPKLQGVIGTAGGESVLVAIHGQSVPTAGSGNERAILARIELTTEAPSLRWLNTCFVVGEGAIDRERDEWWLDAYVCLNERVQAPPAAGDEPPERFRQSGRPA